MQSCLDIQETIDTGRNLYAADRAFMASLDNLQTQLDRKLQILREAWEELKGVDL